MIYKNDLRYGDRRVWSKMPLPLLLLLAATFFLTACGEQEVSKAANEYEANQMLDVLQTSGLSAAKHSPEGDVKTWSITIDEGWFGEDEVQPAIQILSDRGLPRPPAPELKTGESSIAGISDSEEKEQQRRNMQMQIEHQLYNLPDVIRANVIVAQPVDDPFVLEKTPPSASVTLTLKEGQQKFTMESVQNLIASDVPKLKPENVNVLITQQSLRELPLEKINARRRKNAIFAVGGGAMILLLGALGAVLYLSKRRNKEGEETEDAETELLTDGDEGGEDDSPNTFANRERPLLSGENDFDDDEQQ